MNTKVGAEVAELLDIVLSTNDIDTVTDFREYFEIPETVELYAAALPYEHGFDECMIVVPVREAGQLIDLFAIHPDGNFGTCLFGIAEWLGRDQIAATTTLHHSPLAWLQAGGQGVADVTGHCRHHFLELRAADVVQCNDIVTAMEAWEWAFAADPAALDRIECDAEDEEIQHHFSCLAQRQARHIVGA